MTRVKPAPTGSDEPMTLEQHKQKFPVCGWVEYCGVRWIISKNECEQIHTGTWERSMAPILTLERIDGQGRHERIEANPLLAKSLT